MIVEWSHRWLVGTVGILALVTAGFAISRRRREWAVVWPAVLAVVAIGIQAYVGRLVVKGSLDADLVSVHFMLSMIVVGLLSTLTVTAGQDHHPAEDGGPPGDGPLGEGSDSTPERSSQWWIAVALAAVGSLLVAFVGSLVHDRFLPGWPLVNVSAASDAGASGGAVALHTLHRTLAGLELVALVLLWLAARRRGRPRAERLLIAAAAGCYLIGAALGAGHVAVGMRSSGLVFAHLAIAESAWAALVAATTLALRDRRRTSQVTDRAQRSVAQAGMS